MWNKWNIILIIHTWTFWRFDTVFGPTDSQQNVYSGCVKPLLQQVMNGRNASVLAYGPTGSGRFSVCPILFQTMILNIEQDMVDSEINLNINWTFWAIGSLNIDSLVSFTDRHFLYIVHCMEYLSWVSTIIISKDFKIKNFKIL